MVYFRSYPMPAKRHKVGEAVIPILIVRMPRSTQTTSPVPAPMAKHASAAKSVDPGPGRSCLVAQQPLMGPR